MFEVPASKASIKQNLFEFKMPGATEPDPEAAKAADPELFEEYEAARKKWEAHQAKHTRLVKTFTVPKLQFLRPALLRQMDSLTNQVDRVFALLENYQPALVDQFDDMEQLTALYKAWSEGSGITVGESSASSTS